MERARVREAPARGAAKPCRLLACARSGTKQEVATKILATRTIRLRLSGFADDPQAVVAVFDRRALRQMCREAGLWRSGNKRQLAAVLLTWRNRCRHEGQRRLEAALQATSQRPKWSRGAS